MRYSDARVNRLLDPWLWVPAPPPDPLAARDPEFIRGELGRLAPLIERYHTASITGWDNVPEGGALVVGNHSGGAMAPDMFSLMVAWWRRYGVEASAYGLMHDAVFRVPPVGRYMAKLGAVPAHPSHAATLLARGAKVLVYPGGDIDAFRPASQAARVVFGSRRGFVRVALRARVPIVPVVSHGAHDALKILTDGRSFVQRTGLKRVMRSEVLPVSIGLPWGLFLGTLFYLPWPVKMKMRILPAMGWPELDPRAADDADVVSACKARVEAVMQAALAELAAEGGTGRKSVSEAWTDWRKSPAT